MAQKKIPVSRLQRVSKRELALIRNEITKIKKLQHPHIVQIIVQIIGSYQEGIGTRSHFFNLLTYPVGQNDLSGFLEDECKCLHQDHEDMISQQYRSWLIRWFECLTCALAYIHSRGIQHEDIKPKNIIHLGPVVYFTDFSSSRKFEVGQETSTANPARASRLFAAPEALPTADGDILRHGSKTDVFSLGLVFVEMLTVLAGSDIDALHDFLEGSDGGFGTNLEYKQYYRVVDRFPAWFEQLEEAMDDTVPFFIWRSFVKQMLPPERAKRPSALGIAQGMWTSSDQVGRLWGTSTCNIIR